MNIIVLSDIHLGHNTIATSDIIKQLNLWITSNRDVLNKADILVISGDLFHRLLLPKSKELSLIHKWIRHLIDLCVGFHIKLYILEGTPSHDNKQMQVITSLVTPDEHIPYEYIDDIEIRTYNNINILFIPDEIRPSSDKILAAAKVKLKEHKLDKVDMIVMHGAFEIHKMHHEQDVHKLSNYEQICTGPIISGHIHNNTIQEQLLVPGSFSALTHAETGSHGGWKITFNPDTRDVSYEFLSNVTSARFHTVHMIDSTPTEIYERLDEFNKSKHVYYIRVITEDTSIKNSLMSKYPNLHIQVKKPEILTKGNVKELPKPDLKVLNAATIVEHITAKVSGLDKIKQQHTLRLLDTIIKEIDDD